MSERHWSINAVVSTRTIEGVVIVLKFLKKVRPKVKLNTIF